MQYYATTVYYANKHWHCPKHEVNNKVFPDRIFPWQLLTAVKFLDTSGFSRQVTTLFFNLLNVSHFLFSISILSGYK